MSEQCWGIPDIDDVPKFLQGVLDQASGAVTVSFEVCRPPAEVNIVYLQHRSDLKYKPWRDTIFPRTRVYFCNLNVALIGDLTRLLQAREPREVFWHIKGFVDGRLLFYFHDADIADIGGSALIAPKISSATARAIACQVGVAPARIVSDIDWDADWKV